jgi:anaerobic magnesium-protoporphyrin IX monomethyl ester cyclase
LPQKYSQFSFHSYDTIPLSTQKLTAFQILKLRDDAFIKYHTNKNYLQKIKNKFGKSAYLNILDMCKIKLKRKIIEENKDKHFFEL